MATYDQHIDQAKHNEDTAGILLYPKCQSVPWVVIITFYAALQYMEAAFSNIPSIGHVYKISNSCNESPHKTRQRIIECDVRLKEIADDYKELRTVSEMFRYLKPGHNYVTDENAKDFIENNLKKIKKHLESKKLISVA